LAQNQVFEIVLNNHDDGKVRLYSLTLRYILLTYV
jgi:hypothetical protein